MRQVGALLIALCPLVSATATAQISPDVVVLDNGARVRGTIVQRLPGGHVMIELGNRHRRVIHANRVRYAGPDPSRQSEVHAGELVQSEPSVPALHLEVVSERPGTWLHALAGFEPETQDVPVSLFGRDFTVRVPGRRLRFERLCQTPCGIHMAAGDHDLALSLGGDPVRARTITIAADGTLQVAYVDRAQLRGVGVLLLILGIGGGIGGAAALATADGLSDEASIGGGVGAGAGAVLLIAMGLGFLLSGDAAEIRFVPGLSQPSGARQ